MIRLVRKIVRSHRERLLSLAMLPAFFLATLPHSACICGDGHREANCNAAACCAIKQGRSTGVCCGCPCCRMNQSGKQGCCCKAKQAGSNSDKCPLPGLAAKHGNCCHPIIESPAPAKGAEKASLPAQFDAAVSALAPLAFADVAPTCIARRMLDYHGPPPLDAVIVFAHLTI